MFGRQSCFSLLENYICTASHSQMATKQRWNNQQLLPLSRSCSPVQHGPLLPLFIILFPAPALIHCPSGHLLAYLFITSDLYLEVLPERGFLHLNMGQDVQEGLSSTPESLNHQARGGSQESAFLRSSQAQLELLVQGPHWENHCCSKWWGFSLAFVGEKTCSHDNNLARWMQDAVKEVSFKIFLNVNYIR